MYIFRPALFSRPFFLIRSFIASAEFFISPRLGRLYRIGPPSLAIVLHWLAGYHTCNSCRNVLYNVILSHFACKCLLHGELFGSLYLLLMGGILSLLRHFYFCNGAGHLLSPITIGIIFETFLARQPYSTPSTPKRCHCSKLIFYFFSSTCSINLFKLRCSALPLFSCISLFRINVLPAFLIVCARYVLLLPISGAFLSMTCFLSIPKPSWTVSFLQVE